MDSDAPKTLIEHFSILEDTRDARRRRYLLIDILIIAITAVICPPPIILYSRTTN